MTGVALAINASAGSPSYSARAFRNALSAVMQWSGDPVGGKQGLRPMGGTAVVTLAGSTITVNLHSGLITPGWASTTGTYQVALTASETHTLTPADASNPRKDIVIGRVYDHDESASGLRLYRSEYLAGVAGPGPSEPNVPQGAIRLATIDVPQSGGGSPVVTINNLMAVAAGGMLPVRSVAERTALTPFDGMAIYRMDRDWKEIHDGTAWRVQGVAICTSTADRDAAITSPVSGQLALTTDTGLIWEYLSGAWNYYPKRVGGEFRANALQNLPTGATKLSFPTTLVNSGITVTGGNTFRVPIDGLYAMNGFCKIAFPVPNSASLSIGGTAYGTPMYTGDDFSSNTTDVANGATRFLAANTDVCVYLYNNDSARDTAFSGRPAEFSIWRVG